MKRDDRIRLEHMLEAARQAAGYNLPVICAPEELMENDDE